MRDASDPWLLGARNSQRSVLVGAWCPEMCWNGFRCVPHESPAKVGAMLIDDMVAVVRAARSGVPLPVAAGSARVSWKRVQAWLDLASRGEEPFASFAVEVEGARCDVQVRTMEALQRLARIDPRAGKMVMHLADRDGSPGRRWPLPKSRELMHRELELATAESSDVALLREAAADTAELVRR